METTKKAQEEVQYEPQPRGAARISGIDVETVDRRLCECGEFFQKHCDETDYRNLDWYLWRMQLRYAAGDDIFEVVDDAFMAARCLHDKHTMHLELKPPEMFMTRRIVPVELGIVSGMPMLMIEFAATYGMPLMMCIGKTAPENIMEEANLMTSFFRRGFCADYVELTGLAAVIYAGVLAAIGRGFEDEASLGLNTYATARDSLRGMPPKALLPKLKRYDALNTSIACILSGQFESIGEILAPAAEAFAQEQAKKFGDHWSNPSKMPPPKYFDLSILTVIALAALRGHAVKLPETGVIAGYRDFIRGLTEMPERRIEIPGLDEETRRILEEAGVDPDQLGVDNTFKNEKEATEDRAAKLFEERQRAAQEAVRAKIAQGIAEEESHTSIEPVAMGVEKLKLHEDDEAPKATRSYADFFASDDEIDRAARKANEEPAEEAPKATKDYGAFFDNDDEGDRRVNDQDDGENDDAKDFSGFFSESSQEDDLIRENVESASQETVDHAKDFSNFFSRDDEDDSSIRDHVEQESEAAEDSGKSYASFFDGLDENAIPKFDDGSEEDVASKARTYSADFFTSEAAASTDLKMTIEPDPAPVSVEEPKAVEKTPTPEWYEQEIEDHSPRRDFTKLFDENTPSSTFDLRMTGDEDEENSEPKTVEEKPVVVSSESYVPDIEDDSPRRDFSQFFEENEEDSRRDMDEGETRDEPMTRDFNAFFDDDVPTSHAHDVEDHDAMLRELEVEQARKVAEKAQAHQLKLEWDGTETPEVQVAESYQQRMARLIAEKQEAAREQALREREEARRELEELQKSGIQRSVVETLQLKPTESEDPDEKVVKSRPEDLVIKGFAYTELDMIHANTAVKEDLEEDFDMHAAMAQKQREAMKEKFEKSLQEGSKKANEDEDLHVVVDYATLSNATLGEKIESSSDDEESPETSK